MVELAEVPELAVLVDHKISTTLDVLDGIFSHHTDHFHILFYMFSETIVSKLAITKHVEFTNILFSHFLENITV
jgi:hypothetical protein